MTKDLGLAQDAATRSQAATPLGSLAHQVGCQYQQTKNVFGVSFGIVWKMRTFFLHIQIQILLKTLYKIGLNYKYQYFNFTFILFS